MGRGFLMIGLLGVTLAQDVGGEEVWRKTIAVEKIGAEEGSREEGNREEGNREAGQITQLAFETPLLLLEQNEDGSWLYVRVLQTYFIGGEEVNGLEGWISADLVDAGDSRLRELTGPFGSLPDLWSTL